MQRASSRGQAANTLIRVLQGRAQPQPADAAYALPPWSFRMSRLASKAR